MPVGVRQGTVHTEKPGRWDDGMERRGRWDGEGRGGGRGKDM